MPQIADIVATDEWHEDEDKTLNLNVLAGATGTTTQNMTGWTLEWTLWTNRDGGTAIITKSGGDITIANGNGTNDQAQIAIADTDAITTGYWYHELSRTDAGNRALLLYGDARVLPTAQVAS